MARKQTQIGARVDEQLWKQFREDIKARRGKIKGHLGHELENALREYLNASKGGDTHDRLRRIENNLDTVLDELEGAESETDSDGETDSMSKKTENRINEIMSDIRDRADELGASRVREQDVEAAIERNAGTSYKTIQRYTRLLQNQRELFAHPQHDDVYFVRASPFVAFVENNEDISDDVRNEVASGFGWEWWEEVAPDGLIDDDTGRGFQ
jgi:hypothetical protein